MSRVVVVLHHGVRCALPSAHVASATRERGGLETIDLWAASDARSERGLVVQTGDGPRFLACDDARHARLDERTMHPLSDLLRGVLGMPYVVGLSAWADGVVWLLDLRAWFGARRG